MKIKMTEVLSKDIDYYSLPILSKSFLSNFSISAAHAFNKKETKALCDGISFHELVLEPDEFKKHYAITDLNLATKEGKEFKNVNEGKTILKAWDFDSKNQMKNNLLKFEFVTKNKTFTFDKILKKSTIETGYLAYCEIEVEDEHGKRKIEVTLKCKPDFHWKMNNILYCFDLKTVTSANIGLFVKNAKFYKYNWQSELYSKILSFHYGMPVQFIFVLCEKLPPYGIRLARIKSDCIKQIDNVILEHDEWLRNGADETKCYSPEIEEIII
jgi:hypothetical protein